MINYFSDSGGFFNIYVILIVLLFNASLGILVILMVNKLVIISRKGYRVFLFYLVLSCFLYVYLVSAVLHFYYGTFLSLSGFYYFIATRTYYKALVFYLGSGLGVLSLTFVLYYLSRRYVFEKNAPKKIMNKKIEMLLIIAPVAVIFAIVMLIPSKYAYESSPLLELIAQNLIAEEPGVINIDDLNKDGGELLSFKVDVERPNFIIIMLESISAEHMPYGSYGRDTTPNIDALADKSIFFKNAYSTASHSDYAQTSFLSSRYTLVNPFRNYFDERYPRSFMWDVLKEENYTTAYISAQDDNWADMIKYYNKENLDVYEYSLSDGVWDYGGGNARKDYDEVTMSRVIEWFNNSVGLNSSDLINEDINPFFLYINLQATHYPYEYPDNNSIFVPDYPSGRTSYFNIGSGDYEKSVNDYSNSIYYVDKQVGRLLNYLDGRSLLNDTIIVLTSDHGEILEKRHGNIRHGFGVYNEEVQVPLIVYIPGYGPEIVDERVRHLDVIPTLLNITGFNQSDDFQGKPMVKNRNIFLMAQNQNFKLGLIKGDIKYVLDGFNYVPEAYNLTEDPFELNNLVNSPKAQEFYHNEYGKILYTWYKCQIDYYEEKKWKGGERIGCP